MSAAPFVYLELDMPPAVNNLYLNSARAGRIKSPKYRQWIKTAGWQLKAQVGSKCVAGPIGIIIKLVKQTRHKQDLDGRLKAALDLLVQHGVIEDDSLVQRINAEWVETGAPCQIMVISTLSVEPIGEAA